MRSSRVCDVAAGREKLVGIRCRRAGEKKMRSLGIKFRRRGGDCAVNACVFDTERLRQTACKRA